MIGLVFVVKVIRDHGSGNAPSFLAMFFLVDTELVQSKKVVLVTVVFFQPRPLRRRVGGGIDTGEAALSTWSDR